MRKVDYLIVGQGLAGSLLAWQLLQQGYRVAVIDNQAESASKIAAGLINPVTGMRLVKQAGVENLLAVAKQCYQQLEIYFKHQFYIETPLLRLIKNEKELLTFQKRLDETGYADFLAPTLINPADDIVAPFGMIEQKQTAYVLIRSLLSCLQVYFQQLDCYYAAQFEYADITITDKVCWRDIKAKKLIFCEGYRALDNPWFNYLPFQVAKGEILTLNSASKLRNDIIQYGHWLVPLKTGQFRIGANFDSVNINQTPTDAVRQDLLQSLNEVMPLLKGVSVVAHDANVRPTTLDKLPFIGQHPKHKRLYIFNGFGAKGSLQIPYYTQKFIDFLINAVPIAPEVDCRRYVLIER